MRHEVAIMDDDYKVLSKNDISKLYQPAVSNTQQNQSQTLFLPAPVPFVFPLPDPAAKFNFLITKGIFIGGTLGALTGIGLLMLLDQFASEFHQLLGTFSQTTLQIAESFVLTGSGIVVGGLFGRRAGRYFVAKALEKEIFKNEQASLNLSRP